MARAVDAAHAADAEALRDAVTFELGTDQRIFRLLDERGVVDAAPRYLGRVDGPTSRTDPHGPSLPVLRRPRKKPSLSQCDRVTRSIGHTLLIPRQVREIHIRKPCAAANWGRRLHS